MVFVFKFSFLRIGLVIKWEVLKFTCLNKVYLSRIGDVSRMLFSIEVVWL